jgi:transcriptional regulator with AAA-type ATPase domain
MEEVGRLKEIWREKEELFEKEKKEYFDHISSMKKEKQKRLEDLEEMKEEFEENEKKQPAAEQVKEIPVSQLLEQCREMKKILNEYF